MMEEHTNSAADRSEASKNKRKPWYRRKRLWMAGFVFFIIGAGGGLFYLDHLLNSRLSSLIPHEVHKLVSIGSIRYSLWSGRLKATDLTIKDDAKNYRLKIGAVYVSLPADQVWALSVLQHARLSKVTIVEPHLIIQDLNRSPVTDKKEQLLRQLGQRFGDDGQVQGHALQVTNFSIKRGSVELVDIQAGGFRHKIKNLELTGHNFHSDRPEQMSFQLQGHLEHKGLSVFNLTYRPGQKSGMKSKSANGAAEAGAEALSGRIRGRLDFSLKEPVFLVHYNAYMTTTPYYFKGGRATSSGSLWLSKKEAYLDHKVIISSLSIGQPIESSMSLLSGFFVNPVLNSIKAPDGNVYIHTKRKVMWQGDLAKLARLIKGAVESSFYDTFDL